MVVDSEKRLNRLASADAQILCYKALDRSADGPGFKVDGCFSAFGHPEPDPAQGG